MKKAAMKVWIGDGYMGMDRERERRGEWHDDDIVTGIS